MNLFRSVHVRWIAAFALTCVLPSFALASQTPIAYQLQSPSEFEVGCQEPCTCPTADFPLRGGFLVSPLGFDGLYESYEIAGVDWRYFDWRTMVERPVSGRGLYKVGGEFAQTHELRLELEFGGGPTQYFNSGIQLGGGSFPRINIAAAIHEFFCLDSVVVVVAEPALAGVETRAKALRLSVAPNPFREDVSFTFEQSTAGVVDLRIFDLAGREVRVIERGASLSAGSHTRSWDGRDARGPKAQAGIYFARLVTAAGVTRRGFIKLD